MVLLTNSVNVFNINLIMLEEIQVVYKPINAVWLSSHRDNLYMQYLLTLQHIDISRLQMALQSTSAAIRPYLHSADAGWKCHIWFDLVSELQKWFVAGKKKLKLKNTKIGFYSEGIRRLQNFH